MSDLPCENFMRTLGRTLALLAASPLDDSSCKGLHLLDFGRSRRPTRTMKILDVAGIRDCAVDFVTVSTRKNNAD